ncbi:MAG: LysE family translocator [Armatimonadota bacterium]
MRTRTILILSFLTALSGALMPGPLLTVTIAETIKVGFIASVMIVIGHCVLELATVLGLYLGAGRFLKLKPVIGTITVLGGGMLIWLAWGMIPGNVKLETSSVGPLTTLTSNLVATGMFVSISNPYWILWWATVGLTLFAAFVRESTSSANTLIPIGTFYLGHILGDIVWYLVVGAIIASGRSLLNPIAYKIAVQVCGVFLLVLGISFVLLVATGRLWNINMNIKWKERWH